MKAQLLLVTIFALPSAFARGEDPQAYITQQRAPFEITAEDLQPKRIEKKEDRYKTTPNRREDEDRNSGLADGFLKSDQARNKYRVIIRGCIAASLDGRIATSVHKEDNTIEYVMDEHGNFYLFDESRWHTIRHSSILNGGAIAGGGEIKLDRNGKVTYFDNKSGHYGKRNLLPLMPQVLKELVKGGCQENELIKGYNPAR